LHHTRDIQTCTNIHGFPEIRNRIYDYVIEQTHVSLRPNLS